jgi:purine catabolism regulator
MQSDDLYAEAVQLADRLRSEVRRWLPEITVSVGIGSECDSLRDYAQSYSEACRALDVIRASHQSDRTLAFDQLGIVGLLFDPSNRAKLTALAKQKLGKLIEYDRRHGTQLVETLNQYLLHDCRIEQTAAALFVHLNTLRYRLQRIEQISGVGLQTLEGKFTLDMALKVLRTLNL